MGIAMSGTPVVGYVSLTNGAPGPTPLALFTVMGQAAYTLQPAEKLYVTNITLSSNDTAQALVTVDTGGTTPTKLASSYLSTTQPPAVINAPMGSVRGLAGVVPRATATAITAGKTVEVVVFGYLSRT